ncbi:MAG: primosomal protein N', partial [Alistipes sp.]|nr:primosomal protein N' [Alistipes sp.]
VVGVRSSIFLPLKRLQLIVVDEEHDASYKQSDPAPRYNARDCAAVMARLMGCRTLLGSATPSLETWLNARTGKYGRAVLGERYGAAQPPELLLSDTLRAAKRGERRGHFNKLLLDRIGETLDRGEQTMLFQNRRGFAPYVSCTECGWTARCPECNVTLTYHKARRQLECHYCGHAEAVPARCPACEVAEPVPMGFGTEKIAEQIAELFPRARVARLDRDSATSERAFSATVADFAARRTDILVGTQMIAKGFDFEGVSLVGVLNADNLLNNPDFRAAERAFQLLTHVAGRAGRREVPGEVVIQTSDPGNRVIRQVVAGDYEAMACAELAERQAFFYPPYARLVALTLRHRDPALLRRGAGELAQRLRLRFGRRVLGPIAPPVDRIRGEWLAGLLLKVESGASTARARELLGEELRRFAADAEFKSITVVCDVDPQ